MLVRFILAVVVCAGLGACAVHHVTPYVPDASNAPQTADAAEASASCYEASTLAEKAICASPGLVSANRAMLAVLQADLRSASVFGRDALLAGQRAWLLALPGQCGLPAAPGSAGSGACLGSALGVRLAALRAWPGAGETGGGAVAQYVSLRPAAGAGAQPDPAFCGGFADRANASLRASGAIDPAAMGFEEVAGTHGAASGGAVAVDLYDANAFALFQLRARSVSVGGVAVITPVSLTQLVAAQSPGNEGGRFSSFASQTGDYGSIDVFRSGARLLAVAADPWGYTTPASPGEAAHVGVWDVGAGKAVPVCLFDSYTRPADPGAFEALKSFSAWREALGRISDSAALPLGTAFLRDQGQLVDDSEFVVLHMPLVAIAQASVDNRTAWLRARHDAVLDALFAWSGKDAGNKKLFDRAFALLRPAAAELVRGFQTSQGLDGQEATQAGGIAVMELMYLASVSVAPGLGAEVVGGEAYRPRYPILAAPQ